MSKHDKFRDAWRYEASGYRPILPPRAPVSISLWPVAIVLLSFVIVILALWFGDWYPIF